MKSDYYFVFEAILHFSTFLLLLLLQNKRKRKKEKLIIGRGSSFMVRRKKVLEGSSRSLDTNALCAITPYQHYLSWMQFTATTFRSLCHRRRRTSFLFFFDFFYYSNSLSKCDSIATFQFETIRMVQSITSYYYYC